MVVVVQECDAIEAWIYSIAGTTPLPCKNRAFPEVVCDSPHVSLFTYLNLY